RLGQPCFCSLQRSSFSVYRVAGLVHGGIGQVKTAIAARRNHRYVLLGGNGTGCEPVVVGSGTIPLGFKVCGIDLRKDRARWYEVIVLNLRVYAENGAADAGAYRMQMSIHLRIVRALV